LRQVKALGCPPETLGFGETNKGCNLAQGQIDHISDQFNSLFYLLHQMARGSIAKRARHHRLRDHFAPEENR
jgi:hypothetical protein